MKALKVAVGDEPNEQAPAANSTSEATQSGFRMIECFICLPSAGILRRRFFMGQNVARV